MSTGGRSAATQTVSVARVPTELAITGLLPSVRSVWVKAVTSVRSVHWPGASAAGRTSAVLLFWTAPLSPQAASARIGKTIRLRIGILPCSLPQGNRRAPRRPACRLAGRRGPLPAGIGRRGLLGRAVADTLGNDMAGDPALRPFDLLVELVAVRGEGAVHRHPHRFALRTGADGDPFDPTAGDAHAGRVAMHAVLVAAAGEEGAVGVVQ